MNSIVRTTTLLASLVVLGAGLAYAQDVPGGPAPAAGYTITNPDQRLLGDVDCTTVAVGTACITFGASGIKLRLDGFKMTGKANPTFGCGAGGPVAGEDGIKTGGFSNVSVLGRGLVRRFRNHGVNVSGGTSATVKEVTASTNCNIGIHVAASDSEIDQNTTVRNSSIGTASCGGIEVGGNNNRVRRNEAIGNGLVFPFTGFVDFGIGVFGDGNVIEENNASGNTVHGIVLFSGATGNTVRRNIATGNPAIIAAFFAGTPLVDIADFNAAGLNTYAENLCEVGSGGAASACPNIPRFSGHHNTSQASGQSP